MSNIGWVYGILKQNNVDTENMSPEEAFEKLRELERKQYAESKNQYSSEKKEAAGQVAKTIKKVADVKNARKNAALSKINERQQKKENERFFRQQLYQVQDGTFDKNSHLQLGVTPSILVKNAGIPELPLTMPYSKAYLSINSSGYIEGNYHNLGVETLSNLPTALHSPKYIFQHDNPKRIEVVVELKDKKSKNILASVEFDTTGFPNGKAAKANVVVTAFAPKNENYINKRKENGRLLYEKKS